MRNRRPSPPWWDSEPDEEKAVLEIIQELSTKHDISLPADDPMLVMPRMNAIMGRRLVGILEEARARAERELFGKLERFVGDARRQFAQDTTKLSAALGDEARSLTGQLRHEVDVKLARMLQSHLDQVGREVNRRMTESERLMQCWMAGTALCLTLLLMFFLLRLTSSEHAKPEPAPQKRAQAALVTHSAEAEDKHRMRGVLPPEVEAELPRLPPSNPQSPAPPPDRQGASQQHHGYDLDTDDDTKQIMELLATENGW